MTAAALLCTGVLLSGCVSLEPESGTAAAAAGSPSACGAITQAAAGLNAAQNSNAQSIAAVALSLGFGEAGAKVAITVALTESTLFNYASPRVSGSIAIVPNDGYPPSGGDLDSVGLFQQRTAWGPLADRMNPAKSATMFFNGGQAGQHGLKDITGWQIMPVQQAAQAVEQSQFSDGSNYLKQASLATEVVSQLGLSSVTCTKGTTGNGMAAVPFVGPIDGVQSEPDPTGTGGMLTKATLAAYNAVKAAHPPLSATCWDAHAWNPSSDHPLGRACDMYWGQAGVFLNKVDPAASARTWEVANWMTANAAALNISYIIWEGQIWQNGKWTKYSSTIYDVVNDPVGGHWDHVHMSIKGSGSQ